jgi:serine protease Do
MEAARRSRDTQKPESSTAKKPNNPTERTLPTNPDLQEPSESKLSTDPGSEKQPENVKPQTQEPVNTDNVSLSALFRQNKAAVFVVYAQNSGPKGAQGSGFFIGVDGVGVSNSHVFEGFNTFFIQTEDNSTFTVTEILYQSSSAQKDIVVFKVDGKGKKFPTVKLALIKPSPGEMVFAIGSPRGLQNTLSEGIVSGYRDNKYIQTTAEITHGSSGGPLFNFPGGEVIGVTTSGVGEANLNFAIDITEMNLTRFKDR